MNRKNWSSKPRELFHLAHTDIGRIESDPVQSLQSVSKIIVSRPVELIKIG